MPEKYELTVYRTYEQPTGKGTEDAPELVLHVSLSEMDYSPGYRLVARFCRAIGDEPQEIPSPAEWGVNEASLIAYHGLQVNCLQWMETWVEGGPAPSFYGETTLAYDFVSAKNSADLYRYARTMEKIEKGLARIAAKRGEPSGISEYLGRLCEVTHVERLLFIPDNTRSNLHRIEQNKYIWCSGGEGINTVRRAIEELKRHLSKHTRPITAEAA